MQKNKEKISASCSNELKRMIQKRAQQLEMSISMYLKFAAIKDIEEIEINMSCKADTTVK